MASDTDPWPRSCAVATMAVVMLCAALALLASCRIIPAPKSPYSAIIPPGLVQTSNVIKDIPRAAKLAFIGPLQPNVTLTCDFPPGMTYDGCNLYESIPNGILTLIRAYPVTNVFPVYLDQSRPHLLSLTSFKMWPFPYVVSSFTDDNGNEVDSTNFYYESDPAWFVYVPTNCPTIGLFQTTNGMIFAGWASTNLVIQQSSNLVDWQGVTNINAVGAFQVIVDSSQPVGFLRTSQVQ